jgi:hypothetical protein
VTVVKVKKKTPILLVTAAICLIGLLQHSEVYAQSNTWYVAPNGSGGASGTINNPLSLDAALSSASPAKAGDTIYLRGGTYSGAYTSVLQGTSSAPISVKQYPGERATIDANNGAAINGGYGLLVQGAYTNFVGFEIMFSGQKVDSGNPNSPAGIVFGTSNNIKIIDMVIHEMPGEAIGFWNETVNSEVYGCVLYFNGINSRDHGIYAQNNTGTKKITDNLVFANAGYGLHLYATTSGSLNNFDIEGNVLLDNGAVREPSVALNNMIFGGVPGNNEIFKSNFTYNTPSYNSGENVDFGYGAQLSNLTVDGNYFIDVVDLSVVFMGTTPTTFTNNRTYGQVYPSSTPSSFPSNTYYNSRPSGTWAFVRPNPYESGRANIIVYNWDSAGSVSVDVSSVLASGDTYEIRDAENWFGTPVASGTYSGGSVAVPMSGLAVAKTVGRSTQPIHTPAEFGAFVVLKKTSGGGGTGDTTPPSVSMSAPSGTVSGTVAVSATASDNVGVVGVQFLLNGSALGAEDTASPYSVSWDTTTVANGTYTLSAIARDAAGNKTTSSAVTVTVSNTTTPPPPPPPSGTVSVTAEAESAAIVSPMARRNSSGASGGQYVSTRTANSGSVVFTVNLPSAGTYVIWSRVLSPNSASDSFTVSVDGGATDVFDTAENKWSNNWQWSVVNGRNGGNPLSLNPRTFSLSAGVHHITFAGRDANTGLDEIIVTNDLSYVPQ